jgi:hypothetical protein
VAPRASKTPVPASQPACSLFAWWLNVQSDQSKGGRCNVRAAEFYARVSEALCLVGPPRSEAAATTRSARLSSVAEHEARVAGNGRCCSPGSSAPGHNSLLRRRLRRPGRVWSPCELVGSEGVPSSELRLPQALDDTPRMHWLVSWRYAWEAAAASEDGQCPGTKAVAKVLRALPECLPDTLACGGSG